MANEKTGGEDGEEGCWGTWEELLLACAVNRHGIKSWDAVAMEIQTRTTCFPLHVLTPQNCKKRYLQLQRRFLPSENDKEDEEEESCLNNDKIISLVNELRKLRVEELKRGVERNDASIMSLQLKVKRLTEDRERSLAEKKEKTVDLKEGEGEEDAVKEPLPETGEESGKSFKESNSTDPEKAQIGGDEEKVVENEPDPVREGEPEEEKQVSAAAAAEAGSFNESTKAVEPVEGDSAGLGESVAESKEERVTKESSDVQSSASLSRRRGRRRGKVVSGSSSGEEVEPEEVSPAKPQPLIHFFEMIQMNKYGAVFERRLESQRTSKYKSLIRQHVDLETIKSRIDQANCADRQFLRDVLLLINNALVFFPKGSDEHIAAIELRKLVTKKIATRILKPNPPPPEPTSAPKDEPPKPLPKLEPPKVLPKPELSESLKAELAIPISRKRSAIERKPATAPVVVVDEPARVQDSNEGKKKTRERSTSGVRSSRTSRSTQNGTANTRTSNRSSAREPNPVLETKAPVDEVKKKSKEATADAAKKRGAQDLLDRIKGNSSSVSERGKGSGRGSGSGSGSAVEQKKKGNTSGAGEGRKESGSRSGKRVQEEKTPPKRSVGRPPKKTTPPLPVPPAKRQTRTGDTEEGGSRQRKRARR